MRRLGDPDSKGSWRDAGRQGSLSWSRCASSSMPRPSHMVVVRWCGGSRGHSPSQERRSSRYRPQPHEAQTARREAGRRREPPAFAAEALVRLLCGFLLAYLGYQVLWAVRVDSGHRVTFGASAPHVAADGAWLVADQPRNHVVRVVRDGYDVKVVTLRRRWTDHVTIVRCRVSCLNCRLRA